MLPSSLRTLILPLARASRPIRERAHPAPAPPPFLAAPPPRPRSEHKVGGAGDSLGVNRR
eukprot:CAMPEP_0113671434 /NCGR_PEP_ID=MMETSP0038_2-20120614/5702_1 /TAXON_ID=2898 /ORGANISM="Cryptomonas paramecium" /LENGTH=59 /DNA_ID=CAMNT_0000587585 /DNA_START=624 /DNA_END=799 /DNA_ORIENTATION=+ /assembly_acc=CAM_ASM_000170